MPGPVAGQDHQILSKLSRSYAHDALQCDVDDAHTASFLRLVDITAQPITIPQGVRGRPHTLYGMFSGIDLLELLTFLFGDRGDTNGTTTLGKVLVHV